MRKGLSSGELSAGELLDSHRRQRELLEPKLNALTVVLDPPLSLPGAKGALAGIPLTIKDSLDIAGYATTCGHAPRRQFRAQRNALCVDRLLSAGAVIVAKTNTPEMLMNWETHNEVFGVTRNPWDLDRTPGGSSGGESAAIAACYSAGGIGSDGGGSIRLPAALTGICGLKPTPGRVPATGHFPSVGLPGGLLGVIGPMARTVEDVKLLFDAVAGHADSDPFSVPFRAVAKSAEIQVGIVQHEVVERVRPHLGSRIGQFSFRAWERLFEVWQFFFLRLNAHPIGFPTPHTSAFLAGEAPASSELLAMFAARDALRAAFLAAMNGYSILVLPNPGFSAWRLGEFPGVAAMAPLTVANLLGLPALAIPVGLDQGGLPLSVQLVAKPWQEELLLEFGMKVEVSRGASPLPPLALGT